MAVGTQAQQAYDIDTPSIYSNDADDDDNFSGWPHLVGLEDEDLDFNYSQQTLWKSRRCPAELHHLPDDYTEEIARIIKESVVPDLYFSQTANGDDGAEQPGQQQPSVDECSTSLGSRSDSNTAANSTGHTPSLSNDSSPSSSGDVTETSSAKDSSSIRSAKQGRGMKPYIKERNTLR